MLRFFQQLFLAVAVAGIVNSASAFSLLGPSSDFGGVTWETPALSYDIGGIDVGGPMNLGEGYRWNTKTITYGFSKAFQDYFGTRGIEEVNKAIAILNNLPPVSRMSATLSEFPTDARRFNLQANSLGLLDLKTVTLGLLLEEIGLADSERYVWTLRNRFVTPAPVTNYFVIMRNFDPVTWNPSPYVNGTLYTYTIQEFGPPLQYSDAVESSVDPLALSFNSASAIADAGNPSISSFGPGVFFTGLTRDDVGGVRYLLTKKIRNIENPLPGTTGSTVSSSSWGPVGGVGGTNAIVTQALRSGVEKILFKQIKYYGTFPGFTNISTDTFINPANNRLTTQKTQRILTVQPDILFSAGDLGVEGANGVPNIINRSSTASWANNSALNNAGVTGVELDGPGVIQPPITIDFTTVLPFIENQFPGFLDQANVVETIGGFAAFDGTTNAPVIFPNGASIQQLQELIFNGGL
jgi:hypothetical protein